MALTKTPQVALRGSPVSATYQPVPADVVTLLDEMRNDPEANSLTVGAGTAVTFITRQSPTFNPGTLADDASADVDLTITGAASGDISIVNPVNMPVGLILASQWVVSANTLRMRIVNKSGGSIAGATYTARCMVIRAP